MPYPILAGAIKSGSIENAICEPIPIPIGLSNHIPGNISVVAWKDHIVYACRLTPYFDFRFSSVKPLAINRLFMEKPAESYIILGSLDGKIKSHILEVPMGDTPLYGLYSGCEDPRLYISEDRLMMIVARPDIEPGKVVQQAFMLNDDTLSYEHSWVISGTPGVMEKNWCPVEGLNHVFLYNPDTGGLAFTDPDPDNSERILVRQPVPVFTFGSRGSSQVINIKDDVYMGITHTSKVRWEAGYQIHDYVHEFRFFKRVYNGGFTFELIGAQPFTFFGPGEEFCCGLTKDSHHIYISFSHYDAVPHIIAFPIEEFDHLLSILPKHNEFDVREHYRDAFHKYFDGTYHMQHLGYIPYLSLDESIKILDGLNGMMPNTMYDAIFYNKILREPKQ